jgi:hypothetical protein
MTLICRFNELNVKNSIYFTRPHTLKLINMAATTVGIYLILRRFMGYLATLYQL